MSTQSTQSTKRQRQAPKQEPPVSRFTPRLREFRKRAGMTQDQLAKKLGVKQSNLSKAETKGLGLSNDTWFRLSHMFNVDLRILRGWVPPEDAPIISPTG